MSYTCSLAVLFGHTGDAGDFPPPPSEPDEPAIEYRPLSAEALAEFNEEYEVAHVYA